MPTRRTFNTGLLASALSGLLARPAGAGALAVPDAAEVFLNRLTFGATPDGRAALTALGPEAWLEAELAHPVTDASLDARLARATLRIAYEAGDDGDGRSWPACDEARALSALAADPETQVRLLDYEQGMDYGERIRPAQEVIAASLIRAVHSQAQLREVITQFWHDHFNVDALKSEATAAFFPSHDAMLRDNAFGNFRQLLGLVARSPAMLYYLNNEDSRASPANENFARELLELHTLGAARYLNDRAPAWREVPGAAEGQAEGYIDQDVYEVARAFTGWTVGDGRWIAEGQEAPRTGRFFYAEAWHDPYQKRILGVEFPPNRAPMADGEQVLDLLAAHPGTAELICTKLVRRLVADDPDPAMVARAVAAFRAGQDLPDQIAGVIRAIVSDPAFAAAPPAKQRRPFEYLAALYRATGAEIESPEASFAWMLEQAGWQQHCYGPPTGHPDVTARWSGATTLNRMVDLALYAHDDWFGCTRTSLGDMLPPGPVSFDSLSRHWSDRLLGTLRAEPLPELAEMLGIGDPMAPMDLAPEDRQSLSAAAVAFAALTPGFLMR